MMYNINEMKKLSLKNKIKEMFNENGNKPLPLECIYAEIRYWNKSENDHSNTSIRGVLNSNHKNKGENCFINTKPGKGIWKLTEDSYNKINKGTIKDKDKIIYRNKVSSLQELILEEAGDYNHMDKEQKRKIVSSIIYERDLGIKNQILEEWGKNFCPSCKEKTFETKTKFYFEVHHLNPLSEGGADILENMIPLCAQCHAKAHHYRNKISFGEVLLTFWKKWDQKLDYRMLFYFIISLLSSFNSSPKEILFL